MSPKNFIFDRWANLLVERVVMVKPFDKKVLTHCRGFEVLK
jgi:hypothetical protein